MGAVETDLAKRLMERGFDVTELPLSEFQRGGGSAKSLALRLSDSELALADGWGGVGYLDFGFAGVFFLAWWNSVFAGGIRRKTRLQNVVFWW